MRHLGLSLSDGGAALGAGVAAADPAAAPGATSMTAPGGQARAGADAGRSSCQAERNGMGRRTVGREVGALAGVRVAGARQRLGLGPQLAQVPDRQAAVRARAQQLLRAARLDLARGGSSSLTRTGVCSARA